MIADSLFWARLLFFLLPVLAFPLWGCNPVGTAISAAATVTSMALEERGLVTSVDDKLIWLSINNRMANYNQKVFEGVSLQVHEGRVILTGSVPQPQDRLAVTRFAWQSNGVREVHNNIKIANAPRGIGSIIDDTWLSKRLELALFSDPEIINNNFSIDCIDGTIYLIGIAQNERERQRVINRARDIPYVKNVVSYIRLVNEPLLPEPANRDLLIEQGQPSS